MEIIIWDLDPNRIADINRNLRIALKDVGINANIVIMSEPPLISRMNLMHRVPLLEIDGNYWSLPPGVPITHNACLHLLKQLSSRESSQ